MERDQKPAQSAVCPRQAEAVFPSQHEHETRWETDRWTRGDHVVWPVGFDHPRTCSYCGGVHPDDAIALLRAGWEMEGTGKSYKRYLHPPGYHVATQLDIDAIRSGEKVPPGVGSPVPPVKVYVWHFDQKQIDAFNEVLGHE